ncbi:hypothetical protein TWF694_008642 [Orbilia ellipsospora]|uniref:CMP/dCMP-type deaminase domain-containing protein n=1 Tax=Orbilia ellipsospora TaxID=2528407 RepID=A0AAV9XGQ3_9PEZI
MDNIEGQLSASENNPIGSNTIGHHHRDHDYFMEQALEEAKKCTPSQTAFSVGAVLVNSSTDPHIVLTTGFSREREGNTHAEEVCFLKLQEQQDLLPLPQETTLSLYTTMEPCSKRLSGKKPCLNHIIDFGQISTVYIGTREPSTFVAENTAIDQLQKHGIGCKFIDGAQPICLNVATRGHASSHSATVV